jgi:hypothetical protein
MSPELIKYVAEARRNGLSDEAIRSALLSAGWNVQLVNETLASPNAPTAAPMETPAQIKSIPSGAIAAVETNEGLTAEQSAFIAQWSWGGFLLYCIYFLGNGLYKTAVLYFFGTLVPGLNIYLWIRAGLRGRKMAWGKKIWNDFSSYEKRQRLLDQIGIIITVIAVVAWIVGVGATYFAVSHSPSNQQPTSSVKQGSVTSTLTTTSQASVPDTSLVIGNTTIDNGPKQDCGLIREEVMSYVAIGFPPLSLPITPAEKIALGCIDNAVIACTPATLTVEAGKGNLKVQILGSTGNDCAIVSANNPEVSTTCQVPSSVIQSMIQTGQNGKITQEGALAMNVFMMVSMASQPGFTPKDAQGKVIKLDCHTSTLSEQTPITTNHLQTSTSSASAKSSSNDSLEIIEATFNPPQLISPFTDTKMNITLKNETDHQIKEFYYRFYLEGKPFFGQVAGNKLAYIDPGATFDMTPSASSVLNQLAKSCDTWGLPSGSYNLHLKISTDTTKPLSSDTIGPSVTDKLIPFTLTSDCVKK